MSRVKLAKDQRELISLDLIIWPVELYGSHRQPVISQLSESKRLEVQATIYPETSDAEYDWARDNLRVKLATEIAREHGLGSIVTSPERWKHVIERANPFAGGEWVEVDSWAEGPQAQLAHPSLHASPGEVTFKQWAAIMGGGDGPAAKFVRGLAGIDE